MELVVDVDIRGPRERVFVAYRDRLTELLEFLPNIRRIAIVSREERDGEVRLVNEWLGGGDIPAAVRGVVKESMLAWTDRATWRAGAFTVDWTTEVHAFPGAIQSAGQNRFVEKGDRTQLQIRGRLDADTSKVPGIPKLVARGINGAVEKFFVAKVRENARDVGKGIEKLLSEA